MKIIGIDPGLKGGITVINDEGEVLNQYVMPVFKSDKNKNELDGHKIADIIRSANEDDDPVRLIGIEAQQAMPRQGVSSMFKIGKGFGILEGIVVALQIPYIIIRPRTWQKKMFEGLGKADTKQLSKQVAQRLYPKIDFKATDRCTTLHDGLTDSILIADYLR